MQFISQLLEHPSLLAHFSGANNYTWLQLRNGERRLLAKPLVYFENRLPTFIRVHKTALINPACVAGVQHPPRAKMPGTVRMQDGTELPVSRRRWNEVVRLLSEANSTVAQTDGPPDDTERKPNGRVPYVLPPLVVLAVMTGDAMLLTRECVEALELSCSLYAIKLGAELATALLLNPAPGAARPDSAGFPNGPGGPNADLTRPQKSPRLRAIPVVWLAAPGDDTAQAYALNANSVVMVADDPASFKRAIEQLCHYWLMVVQLPRKLALVERFSGKKSRG